jgi:CheY-like chemotaxis protein
MGISVLLVEDEPLVARDVGMALRDAGANVITATNSAEALRQVRREEIQAAVLDINLFAHDCTGIWRTLSSRNVPFAFHTGYPPAPVLQAPVLVKAAANDRIVAAIAGVFEKSRGRWAG